MASKSDIVTRQVNRKATKEPSVGFHIAIRELTDGASQPSVKCRITLPSRVNKIDYGRARNSAKMCHIRNRASEQRG